MIILLLVSLVFSSSLCRELDAATISLFCGARPPQHPFLSFITLFILRYTHWQKSICIWRHLCIFAWFTRTFIYKTSWVAPGWQKLRKFQALTYASLSSYILRFDVIYALFGNLWAKKRLFSSKTVFLGQEVYYFMVHIAFFTELNLQICNYVQKRRICRKNSKYALNENLYGHFRSFWKAV